MAVQEPVLVVTIGAAPRSHLFVNRITKNDLYVADHLEERGRNLRVPLVQTDGALDVAIDGIEIRGETLG